MRITIHIKCKDDPTGLYHKAFTDPIAAMDDVRKLLGGEEPSVEGFQLTVEGLLDEDVWLQGGQRV